VPASANTGPAPASANTGPAPASANTGPASASADTEPAPASANTNQVAAASDTALGSIPIEDQQHAEILILRCEYLDFFVICAHLIFPFFPFLAQLNMLRHDLEAAREGEAGRASSNIARGRVLRPKGKITNLKAAMGLLDDLSTYREFCVSPTFILTKHVGTKL
jgi:hypothetical protein